MPRRPKGAVRLVIVWNMSSEWGLPVRCHNRIPTTHVMARVASNRIGKEGPWGEIRWYGTAVAKEDAYAEEVDSFGD